MIHLLRRREVAQCLGVAGKTSVYRWIDRGVIPPPVKFGARSRWPSNEIDEIVRARIAGKTDDEVRAIVTRQVVARKSQVDPSLHEPAHLTAPRTAYQTRQKKRTAKRARRSSAGARA